MTFFAPGRINLIGEHLDYNGGLVFPMAIERGIRLEIKPNQSDVIMLRSVNDPLVVEHRLNSSIRNCTENGWANYPLGIIKQCQENGLDIGGLEMQFSSDLPMASGLSSSAAIEVVTAYAMHQLCEVEISRKEIALLAQKVENEFIGVKCGIMDQMAVAASQAGYAMLLDCTSLEAKHFPLQLGEFQIVVMDTKVPRSLIHSAYNERKSECEQALLSLNHSSGQNAPNLCSISMEILEAHKASFEDEVIYRRARHVISEQKRTLLAAEAMRTGDLASIGELMTASHLSLKDDYEVSGKHLDAMVTAALETQGCIGARMTGAGFGGCAIALVEKKRFDHFVGSVSKQYTSKTGLVGEFFASMAGNGVN